MFKIDLHSHSIISHDGGLTAEQYTRVLEKNILDYIAITDHNQIWFAKKLQQRFGERIIVGEEIKTKDGEMIGLFLKELIPPELSAKETAALIHAQGGVICIPHPFETFRKGMQNDILEEIAEDIDIIETFNARGKWRGKTAEAVRFAERNTIAMCANSDAHCWMGVAQSYSLIAEKPSAKKLPGELQRGALHKKYAPLVSFLCPTINRIRNKIIISPAATV